ncbi:MAG TPA: RHS repeat-associated core domain-containing protein [Chthoniobacterales bacterium]|nr:RHS repeat-associated core domain-containing protein [Chthoniobacterales bacterium]
MIRFFSLSIFRRLAIAVFLSALVSVSARAQMGNDNPTGISGVFNGNVTTAGSYDPYTGNATRSVTDITVAGAVGAYPLAFTRTMNSRFTPAGTWEMGTAGSWRHNYQWSIEPTYIDSYNTTILPVTYTVDYPDGRRVSFSARAGDSAFRGGFGISDRFQQMQSEANPNVYLLLPDGGKIWFEVSIDREPLWDGGPTRSSFQYSFIGIIDPHGLTTTISYPADGSMQITSPDGLRWLKLFYITTPWMGDTVLVNVQASDGRAVVYNYGGWQPAGATMYSFLGNVQYLDTNGASYAQAIYAYQQSNTDANGRPLIYWAIDPMYGGPMWTISYFFVPGSSGGVYGQLQSENYLDPFTGTPGQAVSSLSASGNSRTETRGDGPSRTFNYSGGKLVSNTDFKGQGASLSYDANGYVNATVDQRQNQTDITKEPLTGKPAQVTYPLTAPDTVRASVQFEYGGANCPDPNNRDGNNPYYLYRVTNERGYPTTYLRDANKRVIQINYPDGAYEAFTYNDFGQVLTHRMTIGGTETFRYDEGISPRRGLLTSYIPPATSSDPNPADHPTRYYYYTSGPSTDRLYEVEDPRRNWTEYEYNVRGQVTHLQHQDYTYIQYGYNVDGTLAWTADENHPGAATDEGQRTRYAYDNYKRIVSVTKPSGQPMTFSYALDWSHPYAHTTRSLKYILSPLQKNVVFDYDENLRMKYQTVAANTDDVATTFFDYDEVGNLTLVRDPRWYVSMSGYETTFGYDARNRKIWMDDPIASDRNSAGHTMNWEYDPIGNKTKETRADNAFRNWDYDIPGRIAHAIDWRMSTAEPAIITTYSRDLPNAQNVTVEHTIDAKLAEYRFEFDALHRKTSARYPLDANNEQLSETWLYDEAGNLHQYTNRDGGIQLFAPYDNRNRPTSFGWSGGHHPTQGASFTFYDNGALKTASNDEADITFVYDAANHKTSETETIKSYGLNQSHTMTYEYDADGNRSRMVYPWGFDYRYSYTNRNQLANIRLAWLADPSIRYTYDFAGNRNSRTTYAGAYTTSEFNEINQLRSQISYFAGGRTARFDYGFDANNRIKYEQRDSGLADGFGFDVRNELTGFHQSGSLNQDGTVSAPYNLSISYDANGNRILADEVLYQAYYTTAPLNQYTSDHTGAIGYDYNANLTSRNGWNFTYDAQNRLVAMDNNGGNIHIHQHYDGLNRIVARDQNGDVTTNVWDNWDLLEEHSSNDSFQRMYLHGGATNELAVSWGPAYGDVYYFQDGRGNTTHLTDDSNNVIEHYTYYVSGQPSYFDGNNNSISGSLVSNRFLFGGAQLVPQTEIYDMRNRFYLPNLGRFMQSDPLGFGGGDANLFRFCGGDPVNGSDPSGLENPNPTKKRDSNDFGNSNSALAMGQGLTTQGWWTSPSGLPTGPPDSGPDSTGQGGGGNSDTGGYRSFIDAAGAHVEGWLTGAPASLVGGDFGFRPGDVQINDPLGKEFSHQFGGMGGAIMDPLYHYPGSVNLGDTPFFRSVNQWGHDHLSLDLNINSPAAGGTLGTNSTGVYANGGPGPGDVGEATLTLNLNFGNQPSGFVVVNGSGAIGDVIAGRISGGWSSGGGFYLNFGAGIGYALYGGVSVGPGGYIYRYGH